MKTDIFDNSIDEEITRFEGPICLAVSKAGEWAAVLIYCLLVLLNGALNYRLAPAWREVKRVWRPHRINHLGMEPRRPDREPGRGAMIFWIIVTAAIGGFLLLVITMRILPE